MEQTMCYSSLFSLPVRWQILRCGYGRSTSWHATCPKAGLSHDIHVKWLIKGFTTVREVRGVGLGVYLACHGWLYAGRRHWDAFQDVFEMAEWLARWRFGRSPWRPQLVWRARRRDHPGRRHAPHPVCQRQRPAEAPERGGLGGLRHGLALPGAHEGLQEVSKKYRRIGHALASHSCHVACCTVLWPVKALGRRPLFAEMSGDPWDSHVVKELQVPEVYQPDFKNTFLTGLAACSLGFRPRS